MDFSGMFQQLSVDQQVRPDLQMAYTPIKHSAVAFSTFTDALEMQEDMWT